jgi:predicted nucleic acid-binding protein
LQIAQIGHPRHQVALDAIQVLATRDHENFAIAPQGLYEMYVVLTRPANVNGFGMSPQRACSEIIATRGIFDLLVETSQVYQSWEGLVSKYAIQGKRSHDARLVALMIQHRVPKLLTFNDADFRQFQEIKAVNPFDVLSIPRQ